MFEARNTMRRIGIFAALAAACTVPLALAPLAAADIGAPGPGILPWVGGGVGGPASGLGLLPGVGLGAPGPGLLPGIGLGGVGGPASGLGVLPGWGIGLPGPGVL